MRADGVEYLTLADGTFTAPTLTLDVSAITAGQVGNAGMPGCSCCWPTPVSGINSRGP
ncbi:hypothetical protein [Methyloversatilis sp.]|uniref:hypothetical protein n=1 Tax=Methyloversatilis sp. TaxID=2569862 RepID=UPI00345A5F65